MPFEGISVKESNGAKGTWQLCDQMGAVHMSTDGGVGRQGSLRVSLDLAVIDQVGIPYIDMEGCHLGRYVSSSRLGDR